MECVAINKNLQNNQFSGLKGKFRVANVSIDPHEDMQKPYYFLKLTGDVSFVQDNEIMVLPINITESNKGALFVNKGKDGFFIHKNSILNKIMDRLNISNTSDFVNLCVPVINSQKGFWVVDTSRF